MTLPDSHRRERAPATRPIRPALRLTLTLLATGLATAVGVAVAPIASAQPTPQAPAGPDAVAVQLAASGELPALTLGGAATSGGIAVADDLGDKKAITIAGSARVADGATAEVRLARAPFSSEVSGTVTLTNTAQAQFVTATINRVTRLSDQSFTWTGIVTVTLAGEQTRRSATVTILDRQPDPGNHAIHLRHADQDRTAIVHVPASAAGRSEVPVLFHFPGLVENAFLAEQFEHPSTGSDAHGYLLVIPEHYGIGWQGVPAGTPAPPDVDDPGFVRALAALVQQRFGGDPSRTYASGMSNGGFFTSLAGCELADVFAAFAPVSGQLSQSTCSPGRPVPVAMIHGDGDPLVAYGGATDAGQIWAATNGCNQATDDTTLPDIDPADGTTVVLHRYRDCPAAGPVLLYQVVNGGHNWPGGTPYPVPLGRITRDISANEVIWSFVSQFRLP